MKPLVVGTDGSDLAIEAGEAGLAILKPCDRVLVVSVTDGPDPSWADDATGHAAASMTPGELDEQNRAAHARSRAAVEATISALRGRGTLPDNAEALVIEGEPGPALCKLAEDVGAAAIVVGSRGRGGIKRAFLGSVSDHVVRNASCPVVVTR
jgi:nucleotide-binding universal stress UspA family protein